MENDKLIFILELLSGCNISCVHCIRRNSSFRKFILSFNKVIECLEDIEKFMNEYPYIELKLSGGEPTIWKNSGKEIEDVIIECSRRKIPFSLVSNGKIFEDYSNIEKKFNKIFDNSVQKVKCYFTIDNWHNNCNLDDNSSKVLDNFEKYINENNHSDFMEIHVQATFANSSDYNLSREFIKKYSEMGFKFNINPLLPWGKAEDIEHLVPKISLAGNDKTLLGDYLQYFYVLGRKYNVWGDPEEFYLTDNLKALQSLNFCGKTITIMNGNYYYCMPFSGERDFKVGSIGDFSYSKYNDFICNNKFICGMRNNDYINTVNCNSDLLSKEYPFGYGICAICKELYKKKVI